MLKYLLDMRQRRDIVLLYVNKTVDEIVYTDILSAAQAKLGIKIFYSLTDKTALPPNWAGFVGRINGQMLMKIVPHYNECTFYLSGSPDMVKTYERVLKHMDVKQSQIKKDFFPGLV